ncbi:MAG: SPOR domain-containing protein [Candidatus Atribacteria bacterium]|nr:SPOR domain-containing protein [Candidatus Atribacteria bacterium]MCD6349348.1 SPOR domain-containing protein [Candidatus Atribacteria bacterium]
MIISFFRKKDPIETIVILAGGLVIVVFAFFAARGDLEAYTSMITGSWIKESTESSPVSTAVSQNIEQKTQEIQKSIEASLPQEAPPPQTTQNEQSFQNKVVTSQVEERDTQNTPRVPTKPSTPKVSTPKVQQTSPNPISQKDSYYVQAGAFSKIENAKKMLSLLRELGFTASIEKSNNVYKVRIYGFATFEEAKQAVSKLASQGIEAFASK